MKKQQKVIGELIISLIFFSLLSGVLHAGCLSGDCINGKGSLVSADGRKYEGEFQNGFLWGEGTLTFSDGTMYAGQFIRGKFEGNGIGLSLVKSYCELNNLRNKAQQRKSLTTEKLFLIFHF